VLAAIASLADDRASAAPGASVFRLAVLTLVNAASMVGFVIFAAVLMKRPLRRYVTAAPHVRWRLLVVGMGLAALATAPLVIAERLLTGGSDPIPVLAISPMLGDRLLYLASSLLLIPAAAAEELLFRGWLVRQVGTLLRRPVMLISVSGLLFSAAHFDFAPDAFLLRAVMGGSFAYMTLRLGGIELACGAHAVNNMMILLFLAPLSLHPEPAGDLSGLSLLRDVALVGGYVLITEIVARVGIVRAMAGVRDGEISPSWGVAAGVV
jgi:membrane protease YdiL (CAAX protease family)